MAVEDLITNAPYEQPGTDSLGHRRRHLIGIRVQTASPLNEFVDHANRMINVEDATEPQRPSRPGVIKIYVAAADDEARSETRDVPQVEQSKDAGTPAAGILLTAAAELSAWLSLNQQQIASLVGISPSTIMAWKRSPSTHPRHPGIPSLLRLWAAVAGAREELGDTVTLQLIWGAQGHPGRGAIAMGASDLAERLLAAAEAASLAAFEETGDYDPERASRLPTGQLATDEEALSRRMNEYIANSGESTAE